MMLNTRLLNGPLPVIACLPPAPPVADEQSDTRIVRPAQTALNEVTHDLSRHTVIRSVAVQSPVTRKKSGGGPPTRKDNIGWTQIDSKDVLVLRSPLDQDVWITEDEYHSLISELVQRKVVFTGRRCFTFFSTAPVEGTYGWVPFQGHKRYRRRLCYLDGDWRPVQKMHEYY